MSVTGACHHSAVPPAQPRRGVRQRRALVLWPVLALLIALPAASHAHVRHTATPAQQHRSAAADRLLGRGVLTWAAPARATRRIDGRRVRLESHLDRRLGRLARRSPLARAAGVADELATTWCGVETATDRPGQLNSAPRIKVVYAHPSDLPSRLSTYGSLIQSAVRTAAEVVEARTGGARTLRLDLGSSCGIRHLDIATVALPQTQVWYQANKNVDTDAIRAQLGLSPGEVNLLVWADGIGVSGDPLGVGATALDERPGASNRNNAGGRDAIVIGRGATYFLSNSAASAWQPASVALHEMLHTLGAVQFGAPNSSGGGHCTDEWDIMCYADGTPSNPLDGSGLEFPCAGSPSAELLDCGGDDYFNPSPAPGSWLAGHWNVAGSAFLCQLSKCFASLQPPSVTPQPASASPDLFEPVTFAATEVADDGPAPLVEWEAPDAFDGVVAPDGRSATVTWSTPGAKVVRINVTDSDGNRTTATIPVTVVSRPPAAAISIPSEVIAGQEVTLTARDEGRRPVARYQWDLDAAPGFERDTGANAHVVTSFAEPGARTVAVRLTDSGGASAEARATVSVRSPGGSAAGAAKVALRLAPGQSRSALRRVLVLRVRSVSPGAVALRVGAGRDGRKRLLTRSVSVSAGRWTTVRLRLPRRASGLRWARVLHVTAAAKGVGRAVMTVKVR